MGESDSGRVATSGVAVRGVDGGASRRTAVRLEASGDPPSGADMADGRSGRGVPEASAVADQTSFAPRVVGRLPLRPRHAAASIARVPGGEPSSHSSD